MQNPNKAEDDEIYYWMPNMISYLTPFTKKLPTNKFFLDIPIEIAKLVFEVGVHGNIAYRCC
jgi:hypothetical protein